MTNQITAAELNTLRELLTKATPGPWEVDTEKSEGDYGSAPDCHSGFHVSVIIGGADGKTLFDALNSDACIVDEEGPDEDGYYYAWDTVSDANALLIVAAVNALPKLLEHVAELEAALAGLTDDEPCFYDHNGNCQAHFVNSPCEMATARAVLAKGAAT